MEINFLIDQNMYDMLFTKHSSFNLGVAITAVSIFLALTGFVFDTKFNLRSKLRKKFIKCAITLSAISVFLTLLAEFDIIFEPFDLEIVGAILMIVAIGIYCYAIFFPIKKIDKYNVKTLVSSLSDFILQGNQNDLLIHFGDIIYFYNSLLEYSVKNKKARLIFNQYFTSNLFLNLFSEHIFLFERTIQFYVEKQKIESIDDLHHISKFTSNLFVKSLNNQNSFLNNFLNEDIYPNSLLYLDELFLKNKDIDYSRFLLGEIRFSGLNIKGMLSYMKMVDRYFKLIYEKNHSPLFIDGYEKKISYNDNLIKSFFDNIKGFIELTYDQNHLKLLLNELRNISWHYCWAVRTNDKSKELRKEAGIFLYDIFHSIISKYKIENEESFEIDLHELFYKYIEVQENNPDGNIAYKSFIEKLKEKIIGNVWGVNYKGYYPAMIKVYFYIFGHWLFSRSGIDYEKENLDLPILLKLKESFPRLYNGFKQEFYDVNVLPKGKEEKLQKEGRKIIDDFLPNNINYDFSNNSLTYYYAGGNYGSRILLDNVSKKNDIIIEQV